MNMKLTGLRDLLKAPSDPRGFGHNFISKKIRLMRKKMFGETRKWQNILPIPKLENVEKMHWAHVLEAQMVSIRRMALLFCSTHSLSIVLSCKNLFAGQKV